MFRTLFVLFLIVPIVEISILIQLSEVIGGWTTILLVVLTAYLGAKMVKQQGLATLAQIQKKSAQGQIPGEELFSGVCILISGVLLLTPGILTDILGFALLTPAIRKLMIVELKKRIHLFAANSGGQGGFTFTSTDFSSTDFGRHQFHTHNLDGANEREYENQYEQQRYDYNVEQEDDYQHTARSSGHIQTDNDGNNVIDGEFQRKDP